jgi:exonuclease SbcD
VQEVERPVMIALITFNDDRYIDIGLIPLKSAKKGLEVLDRSHIEATKQKEYAMEQFTALIKDSSGKLTKFNINDAVQQIAKKEEYAPNIVKMALDKIDLCRVQVPAK